MPVEIELDKETGEVRILDYAAVVDCGTVINPNLARVQVEGGLVQGIGMTLFENIQYTDKGQMINNSFMQYKVPTRLDMGRAARRVSEQLRADRSVRCKIDRRDRHQHTGSGAGTCNLQCDGSVVPRTADHERADCNGNCGKRMRVTILYLGSREQQTVRGK